MVGPPLGATDHAAAVVEFEECFQTNLQTKKHHETTLSLMTMMLEEKKELDPSFYEAISITLDRNQVVVLFCFNDTSPSTQLPPWMAAAPVSAFPQTSQPSQTRTEPSLSMLLFPVATATEANASNPSLDLALNSSVTPKAVAPFPSAPASSSHDQMMVQSVTQLSSGMVAMQQNISSGMAAMQQCISILADIVKKGEERCIAEEASRKSLHWKLLT